MIERSHSGIIHMAQSVPDAVFFINPHMAHLNWQKKFQCRLPYISPVNIFCNSERLGLLIPVAHKIETFILNRGKVKFEIFVTKEVTPY